VNRGNITFFAAKKCFLPAKTRNGHLATKKKIHRQDNGNAIFESLKLLVLLNLFKDQYRLKVPRFQQYSVKSQDFSDARILNSL
jgi:hypothetical protein